METGLKTDFRHMWWFGLFSVLKFVDNSTFEFWANMAHFHSCFWIGGRDDNSIFQVGWVKTSDETSLSLNFVSLESKMTSHHQFANLQFSTKSDWSIYTSPPESTIGLRNMTVKSMFLKFSNAVFAEFRYFKNGCRRFSSKRN